MQALIQRLQPMKINFCCLFLGYSVVIVRYLSVMTVQERQVQFIILSIKSIMRSTSKMAAQKHKKQLENNQALEHAQHQYKQSPQNIKHQFFFKRDQSVRHSDSQLQREGIIQIKKNRNNHLIQIKKNRNNHLIQIKKNRNNHFSVLLESEKIARSKQREEKNQQIDNNLDYIAQINALERKKRARIYFLKRKDQSEGSYKIGVLTKKGVEEQTVKLEQPEQTKSTHTGNIEIQSCANEQPDLEEMHYEMVRIQQRAKQITKK